MPTYKNITDTSITIEEGTIPPLGVVITDRYLYSSRFELVDDAPVPTDILKNLLVVSQSSYADAPLPLTWLAAQGGIAGISAVKKFGYTPSLTLSGGTIWDGGGYYTYPSTAVTMFIASSNTGDTIDGVGARKVKVSGLDIDWNEVSYEVDLMGQTPVEVGVMIRSFRMEVLDTGNNLETLGQLYLSDGAFTAGVPDGDTYATIVNGANQTLMAVYTIPAGYTGFILDYYTTTGKDGEAIIDSMVRKFGRNNFNLKRRIPLFQTQFHYPNTIPMVVSEKSDIELQGIAITKNAPIGSGFDIVLIRN